MTTLPLLIASKLRAEHVGSANAIRRADLRRWLRDQGVVTTDRKLRYAVKEIGSIASCSKGYFVPNNREEAFVYDRYIDKKIYPLFEDKQRFHAAYPQYFNGGQMELFR